MAQTLKNQPVTWKTWVRSLDREDPLKKEMTMTTHSSILAWRIPWTEELGELQSMRSQRVGQKWVTNTFTFNKAILYNEQCNINLYTYITHHCQTSCWLISFQPSNNTMRLFKNMMLFRSRDANNLPKVTEIAGTTWK